MIRQYIVNLIAALLGISPTAPPVFQSPTIGAEVAQRRGHHRTILHNALHDSRFRFRTIGALVKAIAQPESYTVELLREMGARQEKDKAQLWGAVDVVGTGDNRPRSYAYAGDESE